MGYKVSACFARRLTSPPTPLTRRGEFDSDNLKLFSIGYSLANNNVYRIHLDLGAAKQHTLFFNGVFYGFLLSSVSSDGLCDGPGTLRITINYFDKRNVFILWAQKKIKSKYLNHIPFAATSPTEPCGLARDVAYYGANGSKE